MSHCFTDITANGETFRICLDFHYTPGRPAYTPRGEYAPIDPPEPPEAEIRSVGVMDGSWRKATALEFALICDVMDDNLYEQMLDAGDLDTNASDEEYDREEK